MLPLSCNAGRQVPAMRGICPEEILYLSLATRKNNNEPLISGNEPYSMHVRSGPVTLVAGVLILMVALIFAAGCSGSTPPSPPPTTNHRYQFTFTMPGTYGYHSTDKPTIKGTVIVQR